MSPLCFSVQLMLRLIQLPANELEVLISHAEVSS